MRSRTVARSLTSALLPDKPQNARAIIEAHRRASDMDAHDHSVNVIGLVS